MVAIKRHVKLPQSKEFYVYFDRFWTKYLGIPVVILNMFELNRKKDVS